MVSRGCVQNVHRTGDVVHAVLFRIRHGFACRLECGEMHETFGLETAEERIEFCGVQNITLGKAGFREKVLL